jgi:hypothetical protein
MARKISHRHRALVFAMLMSCFSALVVSGAIMGLHRAPGSGFLAAWARAFLTAWPLVFIAIMVIAPLVNRLLDRFVESPPGQASDA